MSTDHVNDSVREEFSKLDLDGKTSFLVEAIFSTAGSAINEIGGRLNGLVALVTDPFSDSGDEAENKSASADGDEEATPEVDEAKEASSSSGSGSSKTRKGGAAKK